MITVSSSTVLVLENDPLLRRAIIDVFELAGVKSVGVGNGRSCLELLQAHPNEIDVLVLDIRLPDIEAAQAFAEFRAIKPTLKIVVSTGYERGDVVEQLAGQQWDHFLQKPYTPDTLVDSVSVFLAN